MMTQKQVNTKLAMSDKHDEEAYCPFCTTKIMGRWDKTGYLQTVAICYHFKGFIAGANGKPTAMFEGVQQDY